MPIPGLDADRCQRRNRIAARRDGAEGAPVTLHADLSPAENLANLVGRIPTKPDAVLAAIHALQPEGAEKLDAEQVYAHLMEAANGGFIPDRFMFLDDTTLRNIGRDGQAGVAFMNSHRTGALSHPSELPFGKSFAGAYDPEGKRAFLAIYMEKGRYPNGANGPSTDDLHAGINAGTVADVSVGLYGGQAVCDVCGHDLNETGPDGFWLCPHIPGTTLNLTDKELAAQKKKGVPDGKCSYTLVNARLGEVSAVYDGAVPGAGFRKALLMAGTATNLSHETLAHCREAYRALRGPSDFVGPPLTAAAIDTRLMLTDGDVDYTDTMTTSMGMGGSGITHNGVSAVDLGSTVAPVTNRIDLDPEPASGSFEEQLDKALAAASGCIERAEGYRNISAGRLAQLRDMHERLGAVLEKHQAPVSVAASLRLRALKLRAERLNGSPVGSS